jgi:UDP:flavonoid glycosyltransferase YjiC (YdhE family)
MRILITACWGHGHVNPVLPLALAAQRAGHEIVLATGANLLDHVRSHGVPAWQVGNSCAEDEASFHAAYPQAASLPPNERLQLVLRELFATAADRRVPDLLDRTQSWRPDLVIHEVTELAGAVVAAQTGSRHVVHGLGMPMTRVTWDATLGPGFAELVQKWDVPELAEGLFNATYLDIFPPGLSSGPPAWPDTRPLRSAGLAAPPFDTWDAGRLATLPHPQTVHLTLGTVFHGASGVLEAALAGLRELPLNVVLTVGPQGDPERFRPLPPQVLVERYVPIDLLLPRCDLLVDHAGAGTLLAGLAHGLPQLLLPQGADQFTNAAACARAGAGLVLEPHELSPAAVTIAARRLLDEPAFAVAARALAAQIAAMPGASEVLAGLVHGPATDDAASVGHRARSGDGV